MLNAASLLLAISSRLLAIVKRNSRSFLNAKAIAIFSRSLLITFYYLIIVERATNRELILIHHSYKIRLKIL